MKLQKRISECVIFLCNYINPYSSKRSANSAFRIPHSVFRIPHSSVPRHLHFLLGFLSPVAQHSNASIQFKTDQQNHAIHLDPDH